MLQGQYPQSAGVGMISPRNHIYQSNSANSHNSLQNTSQQSGSSSHRKSMRGLERYNAAAAQNPGVGKGTTSYSKQRATKNQPPLIVSKDVNTMQQQQQQRVIKQKYVRNQLNLNFIGMGAQQPPGIDGHPMTTQNLFAPQPKGPQMHQQQ